MELLGGTRFIPLTLIIYHKHALWQYVPTLLAFLRLPLEVTDYLVMEKRHMKQQLATQEDQRIPQSRFQNPFRVSGVYQVNHIAWKSHTLMDLSSYNSNISVINV